MALWLACGPSSAPSQGAFPRADAGHSQMLCLCIAGNAGLMVARRYHQ